MELWDTAGQSEYAQMRALSYPSTDVFVICFSVIDPRSLVDVRDRWQPEVRQVVDSKTPIVLVGNKTDLRRPSDHPDQVKSNLGLAALSPNTPIFALTSRD